jgi:hypothetical protein
VDVARYFYETAWTSTSSSSFTEESYRVINKLLENNPRQFINYKLKSVCSQPDPEAKTVTLQLPYISEEISHQILKFIKNKWLPLTVVFLPGIKLKELFCASRPYDRRQCDSTNCLICPRLTTDRGDCSKMAHIYRITSNICQQFYIGETSRPLHDRLSEYLRFANNPTWNRVRILVRFYWFFQGSCLSEATFLFFLRAEAALVSTKKLSTQPRGSRNAAVG